MTRTVHSPKPPPPVTPDERLGHIPFRFSHTSATLGWPGPGVECDAQQPPSDTAHPPLEAPSIMRTGKTVAERAERRCEDPWYDGTGASHAMSVVPPGVETPRRWRDTRDSHHSQLSPTLVPKVPEEAFYRDPAQVYLPAHLYDRPNPEVDTLKALRNELLNGGPGGRLCAESLANVLVVQMIRQVADGPAVEGFVRGLRGRLPRHAIRAVEAFIDAHLDQNFALADLAAVAHLSEFHFARQFKQTTGLPPHQFVIHRRVDRAKRLIAARRLSLAQVAAAAGFSDQSHLTRLFKRLVGITPGRFTPSRFA